jgi:hypothetical protein
MLVQLVRSMLVAAALSAARGALVTVAAGSEVISTKFI